METFAPAAALEDAARELVDDLRLAVLDDVVHVPLEELFRAERGLELMDEVLVDVLVEVVDVECLLDAADAVLGRHARALRLVDLVVPVALEALHDPGEPVVELLRIVGAARDDQRRAGLVDEDRVDLVDDAVLVPALDDALERDGHVVAQVVEAELGVGAVGDRRRVGALLLFPCLLVDPVLVFQEHQHVLSHHCASMWSPTGRISMP